MVLSHIGLDRISHSGYPQIRRSSLRRRFKAVSWTFRFLLSVLLFSSLHLRSIVPLLKETPSFLLEHNDISVRIDEFNAWARRCRHITSKEERLDLGFADGKLAEVLGRWVRMRVANCVLLTCECSIVLLLHLSRHVPSLLQAYSLLPAGVGDEVRHSELHEGGGYGELHDVGGLLSAAGLARGSLIYDAGSGLLA